MKESQTADAPYKSDREPEVGERALAVPLDEYVTALDVPVSDRRFSPGAENLGVKMSDSRGDRETNREQARMIEDGGLQIIVERSSLVVVGYEEHLRPRAGALYVGGDETEDVVVSHENGLINLRFAKPRGLLEGEENFDGDFLASPAGQPDLAVAALADALRQGELLGDRSLNEQRQTGAGTAALLYEVLQRALGRHQARSTLFPSVPRVDDYHRDAEYNETDREGRREDYQRGAGSQRVRRRRRGRTRLVLREYVLVAEGGVVAAYYTLALEMGHQVALALHESLLVRRQTAVRVLGLVPSGLRVPDLLDGAETVTSRPALARAILTVVRTVALAVTGYRHRCNKSDKKQIVISSCLFCFFLS